MKIIDKDELVAKTRKAIKAQLAFNQAMAEVCIELNLEDDDTKGRERAEADLLGIAGEVTGEMEVSWHWVAHDMKRSIGEQRLV